MTIYEKLKLSPTEALDFFNRRHELRAQGPTKSTVGKYKTIAIPSDLHDALRRYCNAKGIKLGPFVVRLIKKNVALGRH